MFKELSKNNKRIMRSTTGQLFKEISCVAEKMLGFFLLLCYWISPTWGFEEFKDQHAVTHLTNTTLPESWTDDEGMRKEFGIYQCYKGEFHHVYAKGCHVLTGEIFILSYSKSGKPIFRASSPTLFLSGTSHQKPFFSFVGHIKDAPSLISQKRPQTTQASFFRDMTKEKRKFGLYQRHTNKLYHIYATGHLQDRKEPLLFYRSMYGQHIFWVRPLSSFRVQTHRNDKSAFQFIQLLPTLLPGLLRASIC